MRLPLYLMSFALGAFTALCMAPLSFWPILFITLPTFYLIQERARAPRHAFLSGWLFGFGYFVFSLSWIGNALLVEGNDYAWAWPLAVAGLPFLLAFFFAYACFSAKLFLNLRNISGFLGFIACLSLFEWLRGHVFTGFPWNLFGMSWVDVLPVIQITALSDIYGLTFLTLLWACAPALLWLRRDRASYITVALITLSFIGAYAYGVWRIKHADQHSLAQPTQTRIRVIQPNIAQADKWDRDKLYQNAMRHITPSHNPDMQTQTETTNTLIIWPETALVDWLYQDPYIHENIKSALQSYDGDTHLITGMLRHENGGKTLRNSVVQIDKNGRITGHYNKSHLVPFGEYIPFKQLIPLRTVTQFSGFARGNGATTLSAGGASYAPAICYEIIFPKQIINKNHSTPDFILTVTNDAWYGRSAGPYQHYTQAIFRALETGLPVVRAANTGISGIITPLGTSIARTKLLESETLDTKIPTKMETFGTFKPYYENLFAFLHLCLIYFGYRRKAHNQRESLGFSFFNHA